MRYVRWNHQLWNFIWIRIADWPYLRRQAVLLCLTFSLYFVHLYALGALAVLVGGWTFARRFEELGGQHPLPVRLLRTAGRALPDAAAFPPPLLLLLLLPTSTSLLEFMSITFTQKITMTIWSMSPLLSWTAALAMAPTILLVLLAIWRAPPAPAFRFPLILLGALYLALPWVVFTSAFADWRMLLFLYLAAIGLTPVNMIKSERLPGYAMIVSACTVTFIYLQYSEYAHQRQTLVKELDKIYLQVAPRSSIAIISTDRRASGFHKYWRTVHHPSDLMRDRDVFLPSIFANPRQQPLMMKPDFQPLREKFALIQYAPPERQLDLKMLETQFDYALWLHAPSETLPRTPLINAVIAADTPYATLYRFQRD